MVRAMKPPFRQIAAALLLLPALAFAGLALAADKAAQRPAAPAKPETRKLGSFQAWQAYQISGPATGAVGSTCYLHSIPSAQEPKGAKRGEIYLLVTHKPAKNVRNEVSIFFGYMLKTKSQAEADFGGTKLSLFTHEEAAWAPDAATDQKLVEAMKKAKQVVVKAESERGTKTTDTYNLAGFNDALKAIDKACPVDAKAAPTAPKAAG